MDLPVSNITSWGHTVNSQQKILPVYWQDQPISFQKLEGFVLPIGSGKSYGDSCLNNGGVALSTASLDRMISFNPATGVMRCEAGVTLAEILRITVPQGFFIPVTLGTKFVTVGGAIANDVHGKNHHRAGTFGCHVLRFELLRSDGFRDICSPLQNRELFSATIGGLGLTGLILWAEIQLRKIPGPELDIEMIQFSDLDEYFKLVEESDQTFEHTSAWGDYLSESSFGGGIFMRGNFSSNRKTSKRVHSNPINIPFFAPNALLNPMGMKLFNWLYLHRMPAKVVRTQSQYDPFFFPLDMMGQWSLLYGRRGFFQYQFVLPLQVSREGMNEISSLLRTSTVRPYLSVLKTFGAKMSPGILSFPMEGLTVALDFPNLGERTLTLFNQFDEVVARLGGRVYPAKDARMSMDSFERFFPRFSEFKPFMDPKFSSSFIRRVTKGEHA